jgi:hypothetical protein
VGLDKFVITKQLTKRPEEYPDAKSQPHVQVALRRRESGGWHGSWAGRAAPSWPDGRCRGKPSGPGRPPGLAGWRPPAALRVRRQARRCAAGRDGALRHLPAARRGRRAACAGGQGRHGGARAPPGRAAGGQQPRRGSGVLPYAAGGGLGGAAGAWEGWRVRALVWRTRLVLRQGEGGERGGRAAAASVLRRVLVRAPPVAHAPLGPAVVSLGQR